MIWYGIVCMVLHLYTSTLPALQTCQSARALQYTQPLNAVPTKGKTKHKHKHKHNYRLYVVILVFLCLVQRLVLSTPSTSTASTPHTPALSAVPVHHARDPAAHALRALLLGGELRLPVDDGHVRWVDVEAWDRAGCADACGWPGAHDAGSQVHRGDG